MMKKLFPILLALMLLAGCRIDAELRADTIVDIPLDPTEAVTEAATEEITEETTEAAVPATEPPTEAPTEPATEKPAEKPPTTDKKNPGKGSSKKPGSGNSSGKNDSTKPTEAPKATEPPTQAPTEAPSVSSYSPSKLDKAIITAVNAQRTDAGLPELSTSQKLSTAAAQRACELSVSWSHTRPDGSGFSTVLAEFGVSGSDPAENLYNTVNSVTGAAIVEKWMNAENHCANILSEDASTIGVGSCTIDGITYICALFIG